MKRFRAPTLETERLRLRAFRRSDVDDYAALHADPEVMRYVGGTWDRGRSWRHLAFLLGHWPLGGSGMWAVEHRETGTFLGRIGFAEPDGWPGCELAWYLAQRHWGFGYATEGARAALDYAFTVLKKDRIISLIEPANLASIRAAERLGQSLQGRSSVLGRGHLVYGIDRETYAAIRKKDGGQARPAPRNHRTRLSQPSSPPSRPSSPSASGDAAAPS